MFWLTLLSILASLFLLFWVLNYIRTNPQAFAKENLNQSLYVLGILALALIGLVVMLVLFLQ